MTTFSTIQTACALCGAENLVASLRSTSSFGAPDLDLRPAELARSTLGHWVQQCATCGYCAEAIVLADGRAQDVVSSEIYRAQLVDPDLPALANAFLCAALILEDVDEGRAAHNAIWAAWACDDAGAERAAQRCRTRAIELVRAAAAEGDELFPEPAWDAVVVVDLLRRSGRFGEAIVEANEALELAKGDALLVLRFARALAEHGDAGRYTLADAGLELVRKLRALVAHGEDGDYFGRAAVVNLDETRHYYVQFCVDVGGLFCEAVHNQYLEPWDRLASDRIARLISLGFRAPEHDAQNFFCVLDPSTDDDYAEIVALVRRVAVEYFGLSPSTPLVTD